MKNVATTGKITPFESSVAFFLKLYPIIMQDHMANIAVNTPTTFISQLRTTLWIGLKFNHRSVATTPRSNLSQNHIQVSPRL